VPSVERVEPPSPLVGENGWGEIDVEGIGTLRDAKLWPGGGRAWDWNETGTRHSPGIQPADVRELLERDPDVVVLSKGRQLRLHTSDETLRLLSSQGVELVHEETGAAIEAYNRFATTGRRVAGLFHTTC
jgi:hypothetical protein